VTPITLTTWMATVKAWAANVARRRRRPDLAEDIAAAALEALLTADRAGEDPAGDPTLEVRIARELELGDSFSTARDCDLTAQVNEDKDHGWVSSYLETIAHDGDQESAMAAAIDGDAREEGRDQAEILEEISEHAASLSPLEDQLLALRHLYGYKQTEMARYLGVSQAHVSRRMQATRTRLRARRELEEFEQKCAEDPDHSKLEVAWITL
jgi:RNA polymerase sigma factor (sigma-70 family)